MSGVSPRSGRISSEEKETAVGSGENRIEGCKAAGSQAEREFPLTVGRNLIIGNSLGYDGGAGTSRGDGRE